MPFTCDDGITAQKGRICCDPCEEFKELTHAAHDSMMCRVDRIERRGVDLRDVEAKCESTQREVDAHITRMLKTQTEMKEYRITEYDSMRRELDEQTTRME